MSIEKRVISQAKWLYDITDDEKELRRMVKEHNDRCNEHFIHFQIMKKQKQDLYQIGARRLCVAMVFLVVARSLRLCTSAE